MNEKYGSWRRSTCAVARVACSAARTWRTPTPSQYRRASPWARKTKKTSSQHSSSHPSTGLSGTFSFDNTQSWTLRLFSLPLAAIWASSLAAPFSPSFMCLPFLCALLLSCFHPCFDIPTGPRPELLILCSFTFCWQRKMTKTVNPKVKKCKKFMQSRPRDRPFIFCLTGGGDYAVQTIETGWLAGWNGFLERHQVNWILHFLRNERISHHCHSHPCSVNPIFGCP